MDINNTPVRPNVRGCNKSRGLNNSKNFSDRFSDVAWSAAAPLQAITTWSPNFWFFRAAMLQCFAKHVLNSSSEELEVQGLDQAFFSTKHQAKEFCMELIGPYL